MVRRKRKLVVIRDGSSPVERVNEPFRLDTTYPDHGENIVKGYQRLVTKHSEEGSQGTVYAKNL